MMTVQDLMTTDVVALDEADSLRGAERLLALRRIRHLPVVRGRKLVGLMSHRDILRAAVQDCRGEPLGVDELMTRPVRTVEPDTSARSALRLMLDNKLGCLPVVNDKGELVGILTEADLLRYADREIAARDRRELAQEYEADA